MNRLVIATSNPGKMAEFRAALAGLELKLLSAAEAGVNEFPAETGSSYDENALVKAAFVTMRTGLPSLADDSGIEVDALEGRPGVQSARFGGDVGDGERMALLLEQLRGVPEEQRGAAFVTRLVLAAPDGLVEVFNGEVRGTILQGPRGTVGFGYDPLFFSPELGKSFGEATLEEKWRVSHRGVALREFVAWAESAPGQRVLTEVSRVEAAETTMKRS